MSEKDVQGHILKVDMTAVLEHSKPDRFRLFTTVEEHGIRAIQIIEGLGGFLLTGLRSLQFHKYSICS